jgi:hypothetical protein
MTDTHLRLAVYTDKKSTAKVAGRTDGPTTIVTHQRTEIFSDI